jgi:hypothetical protein
MLMLNILQIFCVKHNTSDSTYSLTVSFLGNLRTLITRKDHVVSAPTFTGSIKVTKMSGRPFCVEIQDSFLQKHKRSVVHTETNIRFITQSSEKFVNNVDTRTHHDHLRGQTNILHV